MLAEMGINLIPVEEDEGDVDRYIISKRLAVDRRTGNSFLNGIMDKTLFTSAIYLREHFRLPVLIVEGGFNSEYRGFDPQAVRGALSSIMLEYGLNVISTPDLDETIRLIAMMARQEQIGIPEISLIPKRKAASFADLQRRVIEMLPGCGRVMARDLLQYFGSVERIIHASEAELRRIRGIGAKKAREIRKVLTAEYEAVDTEKELEDAIAADHGLLFDRPVSLIARQHHIYDDEKGRHVVDLVFFEPAAREIILVELKRGRPEPLHRDQLRRYLDHAGESRLIRRYLDEGCELRGILASPAPGKLAALHGDITVQEVDSERVIEILKEFRRKRLEDGQ